jgi:molybdopterin molybdotransferase
MVTVAEAERLVLESVGRLPAERCKLQEAAGRVLRQAIVADRDGPPGDRATLDGVCLRSSEWTADRREWRVAGTQAAGAAPLPAPGEGECLEIMTGALVPSPCDAVLPVEDYTREGDTMRARAETSLARGQGVHPAGSDFQAGAELHPGGRRLTGREIAVAASCGCAFVDVTVEPKVALLTTGDELVEIDEIPKPHQIRRSNDLALKAVLAAAGCTKIELNHLPDNPQAISWNLERLVQQADVIIVTGGISKGRFDFLPGALQELGVTERFHGVAQRPGKPMYFGTIEREGDFLHPEDTRVVAVFALPGNPVSAFACLHRYVLPALERMRGITTPRLAEKAFLAASVQRHPKLTLFMPVVLVVADDGRLMAEPRPFNTSGDFASVAATDGFVEIAPGEGEAEAGAAVPLWRWS